MEKILKRVYDSARISRGLKLFSHLVSVLAIFAFGFLCYASASVSVYELLKLLLVLGVPFLLVTLARRLINAPRPYELYDFYPTPPKKREGCSFPSRHAYSALAIGTVLCFYSPILGAVLILFGALMCVARVLLGMHFIRDVLCGAAVGVISALAGALIFSFI